MEHVRTLLFAAGRTADSGQRQTMEDRGVVTVFAVAFVGEQHTFASTDQVQIETLRFMSWLPSADGEDREASTATIAVSFGDEVNWQAVAQETG